MNEILAPFLPIILLFLFLSNSTGFLQFSKTIIGRIVAVAIIIFYTIIDKYIGLLVCGMAILFYKTMNIEGMDLFDTGMDLDQELDTNNSAVADDGEYIYMNDTSTSQKKGRLLPKLLKRNKIETLDDKFRSDHCKKFQLYHKDMPVKDEMVEHIYPEVTFNYEKCNPCSKQCDISIIDNKLKTESEIYINKL